MGLQQAQPEQDKCFIRTGLGRASTASAAEALGADALAFVTEWKEFRTPDFEAIKAALRTPVVFDGRCLYEPALMAAFALQGMALKPDTDNMFKDRDVSGAPDDQAGGVRRPRQESQRECADLQWLMRRNRDVVLGF